MLCWHFYLGVRLLSYVALIVIYCLQELNQLVSGDVGDGGGGMDVNDLRRCACYCEFCVLLKIKLG